MDIDLAEPAASDPHLRTYEARRFADKRQIPGSLVKVANPASAWYWQDGTVASEPFQSRRRA